MPTITKISEQKRRPNRRNVFLDGKFAFGCNLNVVARFRLREGLVIDDAQVEQIKEGEVKQEAFDAALQLLSRRMHSEAELKRKLAKNEWGEDVILAVLEDLRRLDYVNDERFATNRATDGAKRKLHGKRRVMGELLKAGVSRESADKAVSDVFADTDSRAAALALAEKRLPGLKRLQPEAARRRLAGFLQRRGFDFDTIGPVIKELLDREDE